MVLYTFFRKLGVAKMRLQGRSRPLDGRDPSCSRGETATMLCDAARTGQSSSQAKAIEKIC